MIIKIETPTQFAAVYEAITQYAQNQRAHVELLEDDGHSEEHVIAEAQARLNEIENFVDELDTALASLAETPTMPAPAGIETPPVIVLPGRPGFNLGS